MGACLICVSPSLKIVAHKRELYEVAAVNDKDHLALVGFLIGSHLKD